MYGCGNNEGQCLHVSRSDAPGVRPMPWLMAYCMAVVTVKAGACGSYIRCTWDATYALAVGVLYGCGNNENNCLCVSRSDVHGMQPIPWLMVLHDWGNEGGC